LTFAVSLVAEGIHCEVGPIGGQHNLTSEVPSTRRSTCPTRRFFWIWIGSSAVVDFSSLGEYVELRWAVDQQPRSVVNDAAIVGQDGPGRCRPRLPPQRGRDDLRHHLV
jgi:hypothetical protein